MKDIHPLIRARLRMPTGYGMLIVLFALCAFFSWATMTIHQPAGEDGAAAVLKDGLAGFDASSPIIINGNDTPDSAAFALALRQGLEKAGYQRVSTAMGEPAVLRRAIIEMVTAGTPPAAIVTPANCAPAAAAVLAGLKVHVQPRLITPPGYRWPTFLLRENLMNVASQIAVIAIIAVGMTLVIISGGIDLSVGSLVALSAVLAVWIIREAGASSPVLMVGCCLLAILACALMGVFSGVLITAAGLPPFIATLGMMQIASGLAYLIARGKPIEAPEGFTGLGRASDPILGFPYAVLLMLAAYVIAHVFMNRTALGRHIHAVGGNPEAARLSGVQTWRVLLFVYAIAGAMAGLGGIVMASQLNSGAPTYGAMYELYVIAAVVVGGASLSGGQGGIPGTLIGAFIIAVIQNGMNLTNVESYTQKVVLGAVILGAVLFDRLKSWVGVRAQAGRDTVRL